MTVNEMIERLQKGETIGVDEYADKYPQLAHVLRDMIPALEAVCGSTARPQSGQCWVPSLWNLRSTVLRVQRRTSAVRRRPVPEHSRTKTSWLRSGLRSR